MSKIDDGGPAFPVSTRPTDVVEGEEARVPYSHQDSVITWTFGGMTLRDHFAAKCLEGFWASEEGDMPKDKEFEQHRAEMCLSFYGWADAMIAARKVGA